MDLNRGNFISNYWVCATTTDVISVEDPSTGRPFAQLRVADASMVAAAVAAANAAFGAWAGRSGKSRARYLDDMAAALERRHRELVALICRNNGKPASEAGSDVVEAAACLQHHAKLARDLDDRQARPLAHSGAGFGSDLYLAPVGPAALILPWNFPLKLAAWKLGPALAAGCTVVVKPSPVAPLAENIWGLVAEEVKLPEGVLNIVHGGAEVGRALVEHPDIAKISFTGSTGVGQFILRAAAHDIKRVGLELGGKSPILVFADADMELATRLAAAGVFYNCGQCCDATGRLLVQEGAAERLLPMLKASAETIRVGPPETAADMGPLISRAQYERVVAYLRVAKEEGLAVLTGGIDAVAHGAGYFVPPTIYVDVPPMSRLWNEEIFGPVLTVARFATEAEAIAQANRTEYGLAATVVCEDEARATRVARAIVAGHVYVNTPAAIPPELVWGGFKRSGLGRELGSFGIAGYLEPKVISTRARA